MNKVEKMIAKLGDREFSIENMIKAEYELNCENKNNMSYWLDKVKDCGINIPKTVIIPIDFELFKALNQDKYSEEFVAWFNNRILSLLENSGLNIDGELFVKTGVYSGKFNFEYCHVKENSKDKIGEHLLRVYYDGLNVGANCAKELVVREFIKNSKELPQIYNGMPLNTEFRLFYDFTNRKVLGIFNYWDKETMIRAFSNCDWYAKDLETFKGYIDVLEEEFNSHKDQAIELVDKAMKNVEGLDGVWSVDLMYIDGVYWLIDMAIGEESYYYSELESL